MTWKEKAIGYGMTRVRKALIKIGNNMRMVDMSQTMLEELNTVVLSKGTLALGMTCHVLVLSIVLFVKEVSVLFRLEFSSILVNEVTNNYSLLTN